MYLNAPNSRIPHTNQGWHVGSNHDCQLRETKMHSIWTFVGKCSRIYLTGVVVVGGHVFVHMCVCVRAFILCACVYSKLSQNAVGQTVL